MTRTEGDPGVVDGDAERAPRSWLHDGSEECPHCLQLYVYETERRCVECEGPLCPICADVRRETVIVVCPDCRS